jgi:ribosome maturation factor RimP
MMHPKELASHVAGLIVPVLDADHFELVDVVFRSETGRWVLRIYVDKPEGVRVEDCATLSRKIEDQIEVEGIIPHGYCLEVSSPGLDRILNKESDFRRFSGMTAKVEMRTSLEGRKHFKGKIGECDSEIVELIDAEGTAFRLALQDISKARLQIETSIGGKTTKPRTGVRTKKKRK